MRRKTDQNESAGVLMIGVQETKSTRRQFITLYGETMRRFENGNCMICIMTENYDLYTLSI